MAKTNTQSLNFESALSDLTQIVEKLEHGDTLSLEQALGFFEQGVKLTKVCQQALRAAEQKVKILTQADATAPLEDFAQQEDPTNSNDSAE